MNVEDLTGLTYGVAIAIFALSWKYNPLNPNYVYYRGMTMSKEQIAIYAISLIAFVVLGLLWLIIASQ